MPYANTRYADAGIGSNAYDGTAPTWLGGGVGPWETFDKAVDTAPNDCEIFFAPGDYVRPFGGKNIGGTSRRFTCGPKRGVTLRISGAVTDLILTAGLGGAGTNILLNGFKVICTTASWPLLFVGSGNGITDCEVEAASYVCAQFGLNNASAVACVAAGNRMRNNGPNSGIVYHGTLVMSGGGTNTPYGGNLIENNDLAYTGADAIPALRLTSTGGSAWGAADTVRNNNGATTNGTIGVVRSDGGHNLALHYVGNNNNFSRKLNAAANVGYANGAPRATLGDWQTEAAPDDAASISTAFGDPLWGDASKGLWTLQAGSPAIGAGTAGSDIGSLGDGAAYRHDTGAPWDGVTLAHTNTNLEAGTNKVELTADPSGNVIATIAAPVGRAAISVRWAADETIAAGDASRIHDGTAFAANTPNPQTVAFKQTASADPGVGAWADVAGGETFAAGAGGYVHLRFDAVNNGRRRAT